MDRRSPAAGCGASGVLKRFLAKADGVTLDLGAANGLPLRIGNEWFIKFGTMLLAVEGAPARSILSEGATGSFFTTDVAILNPHPTDVAAHIRYLREGQPEIQEDRTLAARSRTTIRLNTIPGVEATPVSTIVESPVTTPLVVNRLMTWDASGYGGHLGTAVDSPRPHWLFAEGSQGFFSTFFLLANTGATDASVRFTFLPELGAPVTLTVPVPAGSRKTVYAGDVPQLLNTSFGTVIDASQPIVAERAMYFGTTPLWYGGHGTVGVPEAANTWFLPEAATGSFFDTFVLISNPNAADLSIDINYGTEDGQLIHKTRTLPPLSRLTINLEDEDPALRSAAFSVRIVSQTFYPFVVERAMYWGPADLGWRDAHDSFGLTTRSLKWGLAEGRAGGPRGYQTFVLVANDNNSPAQIKVTFLREGGTPIERTYTVNAQRLTINTSDIPELANTSFATIVESTNGLLIGVEGSIYWNANGVIWEGGGNTLGTPLQ